MVITQVELPCCPLPCPREGHLSRLAVQEQFTQLGWRQPFVNEVSFSSPVFLLPGACSTAAKGAQLRPTGRTKLAKWPSAW